MVQRNAVPFPQVRLTSGLLGDRIDVNRRSTIPIAFHQCEGSGRFWNFERAASALRGEALSDRTPPGYPFDDTDVYKVLEGAAYALAVEADPKLDAYLDDVIAKIASAQEPDGYLYTTRTICPEAPHPWATLTRWNNETDLSHELYNLGHLFEASVAHYEATGKRTLLDVALRAANLLVQTFGPEKRSIWPGHPITEMALVRLAQATSNDQYLTLAKFLLEERGPDGKARSGETYNQSHLPLREQREVVGHAVRAMYLYAGMADVTRMSISAYAPALEALWQDLVAHKLYITGGIGAIPDYEGFGAAYELPNLTAYAETCAAIGLVYFSERMFLLRGDGGSIDVLERVLYNGLLSGVSLDGKAFFYPNPLESAGDIERKPWFGCACCPGNLARFLASVPGYVYAWQKDDVFVNLYGTSVAQISLGDECSFSLEQQTRYPWAGHVRLTMDGLDAGYEFNLKLRIPGWAHGEVVPSDLYRFLDDGVEPFSVTVNGRPVPTELDQGYVTIRRIWQTGDYVELNLPMPIRRVLAHERVSANQGRVALQRGPIVYALEGVDHEAGDVLNLKLPDDTRLTASFQADHFGGVVVLEGTAVRTVTELDGHVSQRETRLTAIPYFTWANRGKSAMVVWIPRGAPEV